MRELSIFIDESGDFGPFEHHAPYYLFTLVFRDQAKSISEEVDYLKRHVVEQGLAAERAVHAGPLIRREADYAHLDLNARKKLFRPLFDFMRKTPIGFKAFVFRKREFADHDALVSHMSREIGSCVRENLATFQPFGRISSSTTTAARRRLPTSSTPCSTRCWRPRCGACARQTTGSSRRPT